MAKVVARPTDFRSYINLNKNEARNLRLHVLAADPADPVDGQLLYRSDSGRVRARLNGVWHDIPTMDDVTAAGISANIVDAKGDLIVGTADNTVARKAVGANGTVLFANSAQADGLQWRSIGQSDVTNLVSDLAGKETAGAAAAAQAFAIQRANHTGTQASSTIVTAASSRILGRASAGAGAVEELTVTGGIEFSGTSLRTTAFTGDVTKSAGGTATTIANNAVTNAKAADMPANTIKGNNSGSAGDPQDLTPAQVKTLLAVTGNDVAFTPAQGIAATNVQGAIEEAVTDLTTLVNTIVTGQKWKEPVRVATTGNITLSGTQTIDGVSVVAGDRVLVKNQTNASANGIYVVASGAWTRATDADTAAEITHATVLVRSGNDGIGDIWSQSATVSNIASDSQTWIKTSEGNTTYTAGSGIELVGNAFRISTAAAGNGLTGGGGSALSVGQGTGISVSGTTVGIANGGVGPTQLATTVAGDGLTGGGGTALAVGAGTGISVSGTAVGIANGGVTATQLATSVAGNGLAGGGGTALSVNTGAGLEVVSDAVRIASSAAGNGLQGGGGSALSVGAGTGITVAATTVSVDTNVVARKSSGVLGDGTNTSFTLTHDLNTRNVHVTVFQNSGDYDEWEVEVKRPTVNTVQVVFTGYTPASNEFAWVVVG